jgi:hypothetical protein
MQKKTLPSPAKNLKGKKKQAALSVCLGQKLCFPLAAQNFSFPKEFITIFGLGYTLRCKEHPTNYCRRHNPPSLA